MTPKEASRGLPNGTIELTGAKDADGIPVELTSRDVERMGGEAVAKYKDRRAKLIAERKAKAEDDDTELLLFKTCTRSLLPLRRVQGLRRRRGGTAAPSWKTLRSPTSETGPRSCRTLCSASQCEPPIST